MYVDLDLELTDYDIWRRKARADRKPDKPPGAKHCDMILAGGEQCPAVAVPQNPQTEIWIRPGHLWTEDRVN